MAARAHAAAAVAAPVRTRPRAKPKPKASPRSRARRHASSHGAIFWIVVSAVLLAGLVLVNLWVLQLNLAVDRATQNRSTLRAANATLQSELSAALASPRIQAQARQQDGLVPVDQSSIGYVNLGG